MSVDLHGLVPYLINLGVITIVTLALDFIVHGLLRHIAKRKQAAQQRFPVGWAEAATLPVRLLIYLFGVTFLIARTYHFFAVDPVPIQMGTVRRLSLIFAAVWFVLRWKRINERFLSESKEGVLLSAPQAEIAGKLVVALVSLVAVLLLMQTLGLDIGAILAVGGFGALAIGLAGKDVLSNIFSGFMIYVTRPFQAGDFIVCPGKTVEGTVERIGWYLSVVRGLDRRPSYVPNQIFSTAVVVNQTRIGNRRLRCTLSLRYKDLGCVEGIVGDLQKALEDHPMIESKDGILVFLTDYAASSIDLLVQAFLRTSDGLEFLKVQQELLLQFASIVHKRGADFAFPTTTLDLPEDFRGQRS